MRNAACVSGTILLAACSVAHAADECIPPEQLRIVTVQRNQSQDQMAAFLAQANAQIEVLKKQLAEATAKAPEKK